MWRESPARALIRRSAFSFLVWTFFFLGFSSLFVLEPTKAIYKLFPHLAKIFSLAWIVSWLENESCAIYYILITLVLSNHLLATSLALPSISLISPQHLQAISPLTWFSWYQPSNSRQTGYIHYFSYTLPKHRISLLVYVQHFFFLFSFVSGHPTSAACWNSSVLAVVITI
jgi:hypothetical protein